MTQPRPLTDAELLAWSVVMAWRGMQQRHGIQVLLQPFPPCPACGQTVTDATVARHPATLDERLAVQPCRHWFTITDEAAHNVLEHHGDLFAAVEEAATSRTAGEGAWSTDDIIRNARDYVGEPEPASTAPLAAGPEQAPADPRDIEPRQDQRQPAYDAVHAFIRTLPRGDVERNAIIWRAVHAALDATPIGRCVSSHCVEGDHILDLDQPAHDGPSIAEAAADDRRWWNGERDSE